MNYDFELIFARKRKKITQQKLGEMVGLSRVTINRIERGHRTNFELMQKIYLAVGLNYSKSENFNKKLNETDGD